MTREEQVAEIKRIKSEIKTAGKYHYRDLNKRLHRLEKELLMYDRYHEQAQKRQQPIQVVVSNGE